MSLSQNNKDLWIIGRIKLDNPVNFWNVKTTSSNIGTQQDRLFGIAEMEERFCSLILFLFALKKIISLDY